MIDTFVKFGRLLWDFRTGRRRLFWTAYKPVRHGEQLPPPQWPYVSLKAAVRPTGNSWRTEPGDA